jgi:predicted phage terminase large subunit-like protein
MVLNDYDIELCHRYLLDFTLRTKPNFKPNWFHERYYQKLNDFANGKIKKLMIFVPPQHGKSEGSTRRLPAFMAGKNPNERIAIVSYSSSKARKFNREIQRVLEDPIYKQIFPHIKLSNGADGYAKTFDEIEFVDFDGGIKTVGVGGPLTGEPVDKLIMDDLYKDWASAQSDTIREAIQDWYDSVADTRLHNESQQLIVFTRWHEHDLAGYLLNKEPDEWEVLVYPAIKIGDPTEYDPRLPGEALWPERHSLQKLILTRTRNAHNFESLYQQNPKPKQGLLFPLSELKLFNPATVDTSKLAEYRYSHIDPADEGGDSLSAPVGYLIGDKIYLPDVIHNTDGTDVNEPKCVEFIKHHRCNAVEIESNSAWKLFRQNIKKAIEEDGSDCDIRSIKNTVNKHTRILEASAFIKNNFIFREDWETYSVEYAAFVKNLTEYRKIQDGQSKNKHDDAPDSCAGMAKYFRTEFSHLWQVKVNQ